MWTTRYIFYKKFIISRSIEIGEFESPAPERKQATQVRWLHRGPEEFDVSQFEEEHSETTEATDETQMPPEIRNPHLD